MDSTVAKIGRIDEDSCVSMPAPMVVDLERDGIGMEFALVVTCMFGRNRWIAPRRPNRPPSGRSRRGGDRPARGPR